MSDHDQNLDDCPECMATDAALTALFPVVPNPRLEDRAIQALRDAGAMPRKKMSWHKHPITWGVAASVGLGAIGAVVSAQMGDEGAPLTWLRGDRAQTIVVGVDAEGSYVHDKYYNTPTYGYNGNGDIPEWTFGNQTVASRSWSAKLFNDTVTLDDAKMDGSTIQTTFNDGKQKKGVDNFNVNGALPEFNGAVGYNPASGGFNPRRYIGGSETDKNKGGQGQAPATNTHFLPNLYRWSDGSAEVKPTGQDTAKLGKEKKDGVPDPDPKDLIVRGTTRAPSPTLTFQLPPKVEDPKPVAPAIRKVILRSGEIEYEIESFDSAVATVTKLVSGLEGAFISTVNSEKMSNGKVKGSIIVRVTPEKLDGLVLDLRRDLGKGGELKGQKIGSQDVTKQYIDLEARLKAALTMENRLLAIIKDGKGEIKSLIEAEKELGVWRTKIEEFEGELRYYANLVSLSTLTVTLTEKEIKAAAGVTENEVIQTGIETEDVEKAFRDALAAVAAANGRVTKSDLKQLSAGQFNATLNFEMAPDAAGPLRDRFRQLGRVARLEINRVIASEGGTVTKDAKVKRGDTRFEVQFYNVANMAPREIAALGVATLDVPSGYRAVRDAVEKTKGRVLAANLNESDKSNVTAQLDFEVKRADEAAVLTAIAATGEVVTREVTRAAESDAVTDTKVLIRARFVNANRLPPRETITVSVEAEGVEAAGAVLLNAVKEAGGRVADSSISTERETGRMTAKYVFEVPLPTAAGIAEKAKGSGVVKSNQIVRNPSAPEGRFATARVEVTLASPERIVAPDDGFGPQVKKGLSSSAKALFISVSWLVFGLLVVLPWALLIYGGYRLVRRFTRGRVATPPVR